jgi:hypothetical protein
MCANDGKPTVHGVPVVRRRTILVVICALGLLGASYSLAAWIRYEQYAKHARLDPESARDALVRLLKGKDLERYPMFGSEEGREDLARLRSQTQKDLESEPIRIEERFANRNVIFISRWTCVLDERRFLVGITRYHTMGGYFVPNFDGTWDAVVDSIAMP